MSPSLPQNPFAMLSNSFALGPVLKPTPAFRRRKLRALMRTVALAPPAPPTFATLPDDMLYEIATNLGSCTLLALAKSLGRRCDVLRSLPATRKQALLQSGMIAIFATVRRRCRSQPKQQLAGQHHSRYDRPISNVVLNQKGLPVPLVVNNPRTRYSTNNALLSVSFDLSFPSSKASSRASTCRSARRARRLWTETGQRIGTLLAREESQDAATHKCEQGGGGGLACFFCK